MSLLKKAVIKYLQSIEDWKDSAVIEHAGVKYYFAGQKFGFKQVLDINLEEDPFKNIFKWYLLNQKKLCGTMFLVIQNNEIKKRVLGQLYYSADPDILKKIKVRSLSDINYQVPVTTNLPENLGNILLAHLTAPLCVRQFVVSLLLKKGAFITSVYLKSEGFGDQDIIAYFSWLDPTYDYKKIVDWVFDQRISWDQVFCNALRKKPEEEKTFQFHLGDLPLTLTGCQMCPRNG